MNEILNDFGALSAKVKAMYGRRLRYADFLHIASMPDVRGVLDYLRQTGWAPAMVKLDGLPLNRANLEAVLREQTREEYVRLNYFVPRDDKLLLSYPVLLAELEGILACLRRLKAGRVSEPRSLPQRFLLHSKMDHRALAACASYDELAAAARHTIYAGALDHLRRSQPQELPDYQVAESMLRTVYYSHLFRVMSRHYTGPVREELLHTLGTQADLLNIIHLLRLKRYFPEEQDHLPYLLPFHYRMKPAQLNQLFAAPSLDAAFALLQETRYAQAFQDVEVSEVEDYYRQAMYRLYRRQLIAGEPCVCTAIAYLHIKDAETSCLINAIESVNYGVPFDDGFVKLVSA